MESNNVLNPITLEDNNNDLSPKAKYRKLLHNALTSTSINGLSQAFVKKKKRYRLFWLLIFVLGLIAFIINFFNITERYLERPILTQYRTSKTPFSWPHFTFCNPANPIPFWRSQTLYKKWRSMFVKAYHTPLLKYGESRKKAIWEQYLAISSISPSEFFSEVVKSTIFKVSITHEDSSISAYSSYMDLFHDLSNIEELFEIRMDTIRSPIPCVTLIPQRLETSLENRHRLIAIKVYLLMDLKSYMLYDMGFENRKLYFYVTEPNSTILSKTPFYILPGTDSSFLITQRTHHRISQCTTKQFNIDLYNLNMNKTRQFYGKFDDCRSLVSQETFVGRCGCYNPYLPIYKLPGKEPILCTNMSLFNNETLKSNIECLNQLLEENTHSKTFMNKISERCGDLEKPHCTQNSYSVIRDTTYWQKTLSPSRKKIVQAFIPYFPNAPANATEADDFPRKNLAILKVEWDRKPTETTFEEYAYPFSRYMSDVGGILGLWIGFSVISVFEVIEIVYMSVQFAKASDSKN